MNYNDFSRDAKPNATLHFPLLSPGGHLAWQEDMNADYFKVNARKHRVLTTL
ncbi:hypothetical protein ACFL5K_00825 [Gemmatimonadota bacterium]